MAEEGDADFPNPEPTPSQDDLSQTGKEWSLENCKMEILNHRKRPQQSYMTLVLQFTFDYEPEPKTVGKIFVPYNQSNTCPFSCWIPIF